MAWLVGWVVEYLVRIRHGDVREMGYVPAGFYGGLCLGRLILIEPTHRYGERRMLLLYSMLCFAMQLVFWLVPNIVSTIAMFTVIGFLTGPFFATVSLTILLSTLGRVLDIYLKASRGCQWHLRFSRNKYNILHSVSHSSPCVELLKKPSINYSRLDLRCCTSRSRNIPLPYWTHNSSCRHTSFAAHRRRSDCCNWYYMGVYSGYSR